MEGRPAGDDRGGAYNNAGMIGRDDGVCHVYSETWHAYVVPRHRSYLAAPRQTPPLEKHGHKCIVLFIEFVAPRLVLSASF
jgi:hypothetical protein